MTGCGGDGTNALRVAESPIAATIERHPAVVRNHTDGSRSWRCLCDCVSASERGHALHVAAAVLDALVAAGFVLVRRSAVVDAIQWRDWDAVRALLPAPTTKEQQP